ncbi:hypothetical protein BDR06DRAFT_207650 [Suillus hirtellus]|nr:hypothetical protein BDR06DRAFT_207650 [Suillus hirtellus]
MHEGSITNPPPSGFTSLVDSAQPPSPLLVVGLCLRVVSCSVGVIVDLPFLSLPLSIRNIRNSPHIFTYHSYHCQMSLSLASTSFSLHTPLWLMIAHIWMSFSNATVPM